MASSPQPRAHLRVVPTSSAGVPQAPAQPQTPPSLEAAYRRYAPYVAAIALRILGRDDELDDLVQDVFLDAAKGLSGLREAAAIRGWLAKIAVRAASRRLRQTKLRRAFLLERDPVEYEALASPDVDPEQRALLARVYRALETLPTPERVAWVLRHVQGEPLHVGATLCGCSLSTYQRRLRRAAAQLDRELLNG